MKPVKIHEASHGGKAGGLKGRVVIKPGFDAVPEGFEDYLSCAAQRRPICIEFAGHGTR